MPKPKPRFFGLLKPKRKNSPKRAFHSFESEEGQVQLLNYKNKRRLFKPVGDKNFARQRELEHRITQLIFPDNVPKVVGLTQEKEMPSILVARDHLHKNSSYAKMKESAPEKYGIVMNIVKRDKNHKAFQKIWYKTNKELRNTELPINFGVEDMFFEAKSTAGAMGLGNEFKEHMDFYRKEGLPLHKKIRGWGITMSDSPPNYVNSNGTPVIVDHVVNLDAEKLRSKLKSKNNLSLATKTRIKTYLKEWGRVSSEIQKARDNYTYKKLPEIKIEKKVEKLPEAIKSRRIYGFDTEESQVQLLRRKGRHEVFRPEGSKNDAERTFIELRMLHTIAPEKSAKPRAVVSSYDNPAAKERYLNRKPHETWGVTTDVVRKRSVDYKRFQEDFYDGLWTIKHEDNPTFNKMKFILEEGKLNAKRRGYEKEYDNHLKFYTEKGLPAQKEISEMGIHMPDSPNNVINSGGTPVFIDHPVKIDIEKLRKSAKTLPLLRRIRMNGLIHDWEKLNK